MDPAQPYSTRDDIIVITDEAHRTQYGRLALTLRNALPNAAYTLACRHPSTVIDPVNLGPLA